MSENSLQELHNIHRSDRYPVIWLILLVGILLVGAYFRFVGLDWDDSQHLHPDERFLTMVTSSIQPVTSLGAYFDTATSSLNPNNQGYGFYVYGTLPIFLVRYLADAVNMTGYDQVYLVGRVVSASLDILTIILIYLITVRLFGNRRMALLAAAFDALAVMQIQLSHYATVDIPANFFIFLAFYVATYIQTSTSDAGRNGAALNLDGFRALFTNWGGAVPYAVFGLVAGMALASKISAAPLVLLLPGAAWLWALRQTPERKNQIWPLILRNLVIGGFFAILSFRIFQPYAFSGPGFLGILPSEKWLNTLRELAAQTSGDVDAPFALQWARRSITFAWENMVNWGLGLPLGLLSWAGFLWMGWRILRGEWRQNIILWGWTAFFFTWQSLQGNPSMRYQIPVYPTLAIIAAWMLVRVANFKIKGQPRYKWLKSIPWPKIFSIGLGVGVLGATFAWAVAFTQIYLRPHTRVEATHWIYQNVPGPINIKYDTKDGSFNQPLSYPYDASITSDRPYITQLALEKDAAISGFDLPQLKITILDATPVFLRASIFDPEDQGREISQGTLSPSFNTKQENYTLNLDRITILKGGKTYGLKLEISQGKSTALLTAPIQLLTSTSFWLDTIRNQNHNLQNEKPVNIIYKPSSAGKLQRLTLPVEVPTNTQSAKLTINVAVFDRLAQSILIGSATNQFDSIQGRNSVGLSFDPPISLITGREYTLSVDYSGLFPTLQINGNIEVGSFENMLKRSLPYPVRLLNQNEAYIDNFTANATGSVSEIFLPYALQQNPGVPGKTKISVSLYDGISSTTAITQAEVMLEPNQTPGSKGTPLTIKFPAPVRLFEDKPYFLRLEMLSPGVLALRGSSPANESTWDDGLPLRMDNYDGYGGLYQRDLRFEMYWDDNQDKVQRFVTTLDQADYLFISSNRQWGTTTRVQERYPLTTAYYRILMGCPPEKEIIWCYSVAEPGQFSGSLGFELVRTSQSDPNLGSWRFNTQFAEEAFTVYDHPKVLIFKKLQNFSVEKVQELLSQVDISQIVRVTPSKTPSYPANLMLPDYRLAGQQEGGTWSELFDIDAVYNRYPALAAVMWYLAVGLLGLAVFPLTRMVFSQLPDKGYPLARTIGMVLLAYFVWMGGSNGFSFSKTTIWIAFLLLLVGNIVLFYLQRDRFREEWHSNKRFYLIVELVTLAFFLLFLFIRLGNPDLWHPAKGGEKPMDFSYLNAVLKSTSFPPYDPWMAGGYINYYYYGFVLVGTLIKGLGIIPSIAYNLFLPTLFSMVAMGAFSLGWNLIQTHEQEKPPAEPFLDSKAPLRYRKPFLAGISASIAVLILGNLGTVKMIWEGFQKLVVSNEVMDSSNIFQRMAYMFQGISKALSGTPFPYSMGEWYWNPSRAIPGESITEVPFFSFLYGDPHAHLIALPLTLVALVWAFSILKSRWHWFDNGIWRGWMGFISSLFLGGLVIGALRPTNTWDMPAYLVLGCLSIFYTTFRYGSLPVGTLLDNFGDLGKRIILAIFATAALAILSFFLYQPFATWYGQGYNAVEVWSGSRTPMWSYTMHWGVFLFLIVSWLVSESLDWMSSTPVSSLNKLRPFRMALVFGLVIILTVIILFQISVEISWLPILVMVWAGILIIRPGQSDSKRAVLIMVGLGLALTLVVEVVVLKGDIGRMNTVFKFYLQAWTLLAASAAAVLCWLYPLVRRSLAPVFARTWQVALVGLVFGVALFPVFASADKIRDRMSFHIPLTLDGIEYMATSTYAWANKDMDLRQDYEAIKWMQANIKGSPVIVEVNIEEYRWGSRFTINTGLPGVVGWNWHQRQQRALTTSEWVQERVDAVGKFYRTTDLPDAKNFLRKYQVKYIVFGQQEKAVYTGEGLKKFSEQQNILWRVVYQKDETTIFEVIQ